MLANSQQRRFTYAQEYEGFWFCYDQESITVYLGVTMKRMIVCLLAIFLVFCEGAYADIPISLYKKTRKQDLKHHPEMRNYVVGFLRGVLHYELFLQSLPSGKKSFCYPRQQGAHQDTMIELMDRIIEQHRSYPGTSDEDSIEDIVSSQMYLIYGCYPPLKP